MLEFINEKHSASADNCQLTCVKLSFLLDSKLSLAIFEQVLTIFCEIKAFICDIYMNK